MRLLFRCACNGIHAYPIILAQISRRGCAHFDHVSEVGIVRHLKDVGLVYRDAGVGSTLLEGMGGMGEDEM